jgi:Ca2+-binding RTX toxin-like protein
MGSETSVLVDSRGMSQVFQRNVNYFFGGSRDDTIFGSENDDHIDGQAGRNVLHGLAGDDFLTSGLDFDTDDCTLFGGNGNDTLFSVDGDDLYYGGPGDDIFYSRQGLDTIFGGVGVDTASFRFDPRVDDGMFIDLRRDAPPPAAPGPLPIPEIFGVENVIGSLSHDTIMGNSIANVLKGSLGDDSVFGGSSTDAVGGGAGNDWLRGDGGRDTLFGDHGDDTLNGGAALDVLFGGRGADHFVFDADAHTGPGDRIGDFEVGVDRFVVAGLAQGSEMPVVTFVVRDNGFTIVTVGDLVDPLFSVAVNTNGGVMTQADVAYAFLG